MIQQNRKDKSTQGNNLILTANGIPVAYNDFGQGDFPAIFIHGFPFNKNMWQPQMEALSKSHRVIAYDIRGYGSSGSGDEEFSISLFADDLIDLMDILMIDQAVICGLSMGGYITLNAMQRYPHRFKGLILCDTQCIADTYEAMEKRYQSIKEIEANGMQGFTEGMVKNLFADKTHIEKAQLVADVKKMMLGVNPNSVIKTLKALAERWEMCSALQEIKIPALIICGAEDKITPPEKAYFMAENIENSTIVIVADSGHLSTLEQPMETNKAIEGFLSRTT